VVKVEDEEEEVDGVSGDANVAQVFEHRVQQVGQVTADKVGQDDGVKLEFGHEGAASKGREEEEVEAVEGEAVDRVGLVEGVGLVAHQPAH